MRANSMATRSRLGAGTFFLVAVVTTMVGLSRAAPAPPPELLDRIVAVVDDEVILWSELNFRVLEEMRLAGGYPSIAEIERRRVQTLDAMIDEQVLVSKAKHDSVEIDNAEVEDLLSDQLGQIRNSLTPGELEEMLERSGMSERQLKAKYRKQIRHQLLHRQMVRILASRQFITRRDVDDYRQAHLDSLPPQVSLSQIFLKIEAGEGVLSGAQERLEEARKQLDTGADFADVARELSEDPGTASEGGDFGCFTPGMLGVPEFERAAAELKPGQVSEPVLTKLGYHLIQLREIRESDICVSHILALARTDEGDRRRVLDRLGELRERAMHGEDFADLAREFSQDPRTAQQGGLWNILKKEEIPPFLDPFVGHLRLGEISEPFLMEDGGRIIHVNDDQNTVEAFVREQLMIDRMGELIDSHKLEIHVQNRLEENFLWQWVGR